MSDDRLRALLIKHEGLRLKPYRCTEGRLTIGVGRNLDDVGISEFEARLMLTNDLDRVNWSAVNTFPWFKSLNTPRQNVVLSMIFNLGVEGFSEFKRTIEHIRNANFEKAASEMLHSKWAQQVGHRSINLATMMSTGRHLSGER